MSQIINKSAINVLDEFCKKKLQPPAVYEFTSDDVASDFVCTVKSFNETKTGKAKSKKKAKHAAAQNLINHLRSLESFKFDLIFLNVSPNSGDDTVSSSTTNEKKRKANAKSEPEINYIGKLLEFCIKKKLPPASFDVIEHPASTLTNTQNHLREFFMKCRVNDVERQGKGFNKKQAKQTAAMEVLKVLMEGKSEPKDIAKLDEPPRKRLKSIEQPAEDTSSTPCENIVKIDNKETKFSNLYGFWCNSDDDDPTDGVFSDDDCEIIDSTEVYSVQSGSESEEGFENNSDDDEL